MTERCARWPEGSRAATVSLPFAVCASGRLVDAANAIAHGRLGGRVEVRGRDEFAQLGTAFNRMAGTLELRLAELETERSRVRDATARFGEALVATHDAGQLVQVV